MALVFMDGRLPAGVRAARVGRRARLGGAPASAEWAGKVPGSFARGYFNLHGDSPIGGHIKAGNCAHIAFVSRPFMGRPSCSLQFFNRAGEAMFKVFVRRDSERNLVAEQVQRFETLRRELATGG